MHPLIAASLVLAAPLPGQVMRVPEGRTVLALLNDVRQAPRDYADYLRDAADRFDGRVYIERDGGEHGSFEGAAAVREAARAFDALPTLPALIADPVLTAAARDHAEAQGSGGGIGHASSDGATPGDRVRQRGGDIYVVEAIGYGMHTAEGVVRQWIVDDGVAGRGHRKLLTTGFYRYAGIWCGPHATRGTMCVIDLAATPGGKPVVPAER